jgi:uncharacterized membrane protein
MKAENYLDYLDKEMHILGVLSTFCLAVPSLIIERLSSLDDKSLGYDFFAALLCNGLPLLVVGCLLMFVGAASFYKQRSRLAWTYGQMALEIAIPNSTGKTLTERLKETDEWPTWIPYHCAKSAGILAILGFGCAVLSIFCPFFQAHCLACAIMLVGLLIILIVWICRNSKTYKDKEKIHVPFIG